MIAGPVRKIDASWFQRPEGIPTVEAAGGVVVRRGSAGLLIALSLEDDHERPVLPKGHVEPGESVEQAARREIWEEVGITEMEMLGPLPTKERLNFSRSHWKRTHYFLFATREAHVTPGEPDRHRMFWCRLDSVPEMFWPEQSDLLREAQRDIVDAFENWESQISGNQ